MKPIIVICSFIVIILVGFLMFPLYAFSWNKPVPDRIPEIDLNSTPFVVSFIDVGYGDATLFRYNNTTVLIDAGSPPVGSTVVKYLEGTGVKDIDILIASHPDMDHTGGFMHVLNAFDVKWVVDNGDNSSYQYNFISDTIDRHGIKHTRAEQGDTIWPDPDVTITFLSPPPARYNDTNEDSLVAAVSYGSIDCLMMGDATKRALPVIQDPVEILRVGHHGSAGSVTEAFLNSTEPDVAIISVGGRLPHYPDQRVLDMLGNHNVSVFRTDRGGTITALCNTTSCTLVQGERSAYLYGEE